MEKLFRLSNLILFFLFPFVARSQEKPSQTLIDSLSYQAYLESDWKKVRELSFKGFNSGLDFYNLRMRAGLAELNLHRPVKSAVHFRKALEINNNDPDALAHLYSSLVFSGDLAESRLLASTYSPSFRKRLGIPSNRLITSAFLASGYMLNSKADSLKAIRPDSELAHFYLVPHYWFLSAGLKLEAGKRLSATLATNLLGYTAIQMFLFQNQTPLNFDVPFEQRSVYLAGSYYFSKGFQCTLASQVISYDLPLYQWVPGDFGGQYILDATTYRDLALHASVSKRFPYVKADLTADANRFRNQWYKQFGAEFTIYPAGNVNTYLQAGATWQSENSVPASRIIARAGAGRKISHSLWIEADYYFGDIINYTERNGYATWNNIDLIKRRIDVNLEVFGIRPHLDLLIRYQFTRRSAVWQTYQNSEYIGDLKKEYAVHGFFGGLTWRF